MTKWLPDVAPADRATDVAARSVQSRLDAVRYFLKRAAERPDEPEHIHQLRVWARRSEAALAVYADLFPPRRLKRLHEKLRRIRRAAGRVRDVDVYAQRTVGAGGEWPRKLLAERNHAQRRLVRVYERLKWGRRLKRSASQLVVRMRKRSGGSNETLADRARGTMGDLGTSFFQDQPTDPTDTAALHQFRIRAKRLRYAMELLAAAYPSPFRDDLYPQVGVLQEKLGHVNDAAVAARRLHRRIAKAGTPAELSDLRRRVSRTSEDLVRAREDFVSWWTPERTAELRARFEEFCGPLTCNDPALPG
jgi:CHAD domain-containing protein